MAATDSPILHWLRRWKPHAVRMHMAGGDVKVVNRPQGERGRWTGMEAAIMTMAPTFVEALDDQGETLASRALEVVDEQPAAPAVPVVDAKADPMSQLAASLPTLVQLIVDAADAAAGRHAEAYRLAFEQQTLLVKIMSDRLAGLERAYHAAIMNQAAAAQAQPEGDQLAMQMMAAAMNGGMNGAPKPPSPTENKQ